MIVDELACILEAVVINAEVFFLAPSDEDRAYRIIEVWIADLGVKPRRLIYLYLVLRAEGHPVSRKRLSQHRPFRP